MGDLQDKRRHNNEQHARYIELLMGNMDSIYRYIVSMVPRAADADDILQETSKLIWEKFEEYQTGTNFKNWAITIARYKILNYYRSMQRNKVKFSSQTIDAISDYLAEHQEDDGRDLELLQECLSKLTAKDRELIQQKYAQKITTKHLATRFGRSVSGLYGTLARIQRVLIDCVQRSLRSEGFIR